MVSAHMINKTSLSKPLFQEILPFWSTKVILQILVKKPSKHLFRVSLFDKFVFTGGVNQSVKIILWFLTQKS